MKKDYLDRFYTKDSVAEDCVGSLPKILKVLDYKEVCFLEPSAGGGSFLRALKKKYPQNKIISCDIDKDSVSQYKVDFLFSQKRDLGINKIKEDIVVIGNPPFGKRSRLAIDFVNKAMEYSDLVAFIVPIQFGKWSVQSKLRKDLKMIYQKELPSNSFILSGKDYQVRTYFQIWTKRSGMKNLRLTGRPPIKHPDFDMFLYNNTQETLKYFDKSVFKWDFAVPRQGFYNYKERIEDQRKLKKNIQWMFFRSIEKIIKKRLLSLDYEKLARKNTTIPGFGKADVVEEYSSKWGGINQMKLC